MRDEVTKFAVVVDEIDRLAEFAIPVRAQFLQLAEAEEPELAEWLIAMFA